MSSPPVKKNRNIKVEFNVRPIRHTYFFPDDDFEIYERVVKYLSTQWGGICNFLVPVSKDLEIWPIFEQFLSIHRPDRFVGFFPDEADLTRLQNRLKHLFRGTDVLLHIGKYWEKRDRTAHPLSLMVEAQPSVSTSNGIGKQLLTVYSSESGNENERRALLT